MLEGVDGIVAVFFGQPNLREQPDAPDVWSLLFDGAKPDSYNRNTGGPLPISNANGRVGDAMVQVTAQVGRIDIQWNAPPADEMGRPQQFTSPKPYIEKATSKLKLLTAKMAAARLALVVNTSSKVSVGDPGVKLSELLGKVFFPANGTDLLYRLNLQRNLEAVPGLKLNRLSTWQTGAHQLFGFDPTATLHAVLESVNYIAHNVDINTVGILNAGQEVVESIIDEMQQEAMAVLEGGLSFYG